MSKSTTEATQGYLKPENYGYGDIFKQPVFHSMGQGHFIKIGARPNSQAYDCLDAAILTQEKLQSEGISSKIVQGKDQFDLWFAHYFNVLDDGTKVDLTPPYHGMPNPNHSISRTLSQQEIDFNKTEGKLPIGKGQVPLRYRAEGSSTSYLTSLGATGLKSPLEEAIAMRDGRASIISVNCDATKFSNGAPVNAYSLNIEINKTVLFNAFRGGKIQNVFDSAYEQLRDLGIVKETERGYALWLADNKLQGQPTNLTSVQDVRDAAMKDIEIVRTFVRNLMQPMEDYQLTSHTHFEPTRLRDRSHEYFELKPTATSLAGKTGVIGDTLIKWYGMVTYDAQGKLKIDPPDEIAKIKK